MSEMTKVDFNKWLDGAADNLSYLYGRWLDEHEYEDFADYVEHVKKMLPAGALMGKMTKRPFQFEFIAGANVHRVRVTSTAIRYWRTAS